MEKVVLNFMVIELCKLIFFFYYKWLKLYYSCVVMKIVRKMIKEGSHTSSTALLVLNFAFFATVERPANKNLREIQYPYIENSNHRKKN